MRTKARTPRAKSQPDATIEVTDDDFTQASPPPLPAKDRAVEAPSFLGKSLASVALPVVRATIPIVKNVEGRLEAIERRLAATAASNDPQATRGTADEPEGA